MIAKLRKELHPLIFPWIAAAMAALTYSPIVPFQMNLSWFAFTIGCLVLASIPFGSEFENHTLSLFLGQPRGRGQLWRDQFLAAAIGVISLAMVHGYIYWDRAEGIIDVTPSLLIGVVFALTALCSAGFLTLISGSTVGGVVFTLALQLFLYIGLVLLRPNDVSEQWWTFKGCAIGYSALMLWAGWRKFSRLELRDALAVSASLPEAWVPGVARLLRCRPQGVWFNLIRKELLLLRLLARASLMFTAVWLVLIGLSYLAPQNWEGVGAFIAMHIVFSVFSGAVLLLAGSLAASEDRTLGTSAWQLTLPVPARRQWLIKLLTAAGAAFCLAYLLPKALIGITPRNPWLGMGAGDLDFSILGGLIPFTMGFWFASFGANVVRAAISALVVLGVGGPLAAGAWGTLMEEAYQRNVLMRVLSYFQLPPDFIQFSSGSLPFVIGALPVLLIALLQSRGQFSNAIVGAGVRLRYGALLILLSLSMTLWVSDLRASQHVAEQRFRRDLFSALQATGFQGDFRGKLVVTLTPEELEQTGRLSAPSKEWIRNSKVIIWPGGTPKFAELWSNAAGRVVQLSVVVTFPNGRKYSLL
jgi:hypothetical protein